MKKDFSNAMTDERVQVKPAAMNFIDTEAEKPAEAPVEAMETEEPLQAAEVEETATAQPFSFSVDRNKEKRDRRVIFMTTPSMYKRLAKKAKDTKLSMNEIITQSLEYTLGEGGNK